MTNFSEKYPFTQNDIDKVIDDIVKENNNTVKSVSNPVAVINAGQSGSGKAGLTQKSKEEFGQAGAVVFDVDEHRDVYPNAERIKQNDPAHFSDITHEFASKVAIAVTDEAIKNRQNVIFDRTSNKIRSIERIDSQLRQIDNPYRVEMKVMGTDFETSKMRVHLRYEQQGGAGFGRYVREDVQREIYDGIADVIKRVEERKLVDKITIYNKNLKPVYENELVNGEWKKQPNGYQALIEERAKPLLGRDSLHIQQGWQIIQFKMAERGADYGGAEKDIADTMNRSIAELKNKHNIEVKESIYAVAGGTYSGTVGAMSNTRVLQQNAIGTAIIHQIDNLPSFKNEHLGKDLKIIYGSDGKGDIVSVKEIGFGKQKELSNPTNPSDGTSFGKG